MPESIDIKKLFELRKTLPVLDVRSEGEHAHAHIPGAISLPLLNNEERAKVGTAYKQKGREEAVLLGFDLVGHKFGDYIRKAKKMSEVGSPMSDVTHASVTSASPIIIYCWRGGLRSNTMAWLLEKAGIKVYVLEGGYKTFRHWALNEFEKPYRLIVLGGKTGSGKTVVLEEMKKMGEQVIDLEAIANHRGSSFGALGQLAQPGSEQLENLLALELSVVELDKTLWVENESSKIGSAKIPDGIYNRMRASNVIEIEVPLETRVQNIIRDYGDFPKEKLAEATKRIERKLGNKRMNDALNYLYENDLGNWIKPLLEYYDKTYLFNKDQRPEGSVITISFQNGDPAEIAETVISRAKQHTTTLIH